MRHPIVRDFMTATSLRGVILRHRELGTLCGYVGVAPGHPLHGVRYMEESPRLRPLGVYRYGLEPPSYRVGPPTDDAIITVEPRRELLEAQRVHGLLGCPRCGHVHQHAVAACADCGLPLNPQQEAAA